MACSSSHLHCRSAHSGMCHGDQVNFGKAYEAEHVRRWMDYGASARAWDKFFGRYGLGGMPDFVSYVCCAQFAVSRCTKDAHCCPCPAKIHVDAACAFAAGTSC